MANEDSTPQSRPRRASIADLFASRPPSDPSRPLGHATPSALSQGQQARGGRRLSIAELALGSSPTNQQIKARQESNESAVDDSEYVSAVESPTSPLGRRMSFGAKAYSGNRNSIAGSLGSIPDKPDSPTKVREGFNWSDNLRDRAERASMSGPAPPQPTLPPRSRNVSAEETLKPTPAPIPAPKAAPKKPDPMQERILKGDFYMD